MQEPELIARCRDGDRRAQERLYTTYADRMFRLAGRYVKNIVDAEDVMIVAFSKIYGHIGDFTYRGQGSLEGWIRQVVVNESLMWLRRKHNFNMTETLEDEHGHVDLEALSQLPAEDILRFVGELPDGYRTVFNLSVVEGYDHAEIADMLGIAESTSRTQLFKAKSQLRKMLSREGIHYGT